MVTFVPPLLDCITRDRSVVLTEAWREFEGVPAQEGLTSIANQLGHDSNFKGIAHANNTPEPQQGVEFPRLEEYFLLDKFTDDLNDSAQSTYQSTDHSTDPFTTHALGPANDASPGPSQPIQPAHAQPASSSSVSTPGRLVRASTTAKKQPQKPSTPRTRRLQRAPTQEPNDNGKRRQDPASDDWEARAAFRARVKRNKTTTEILPEVAPAVAGAAVSGATEPALTPSDDLVLPHATTTAEPSLSTATPSDMDSAPSVSATTRKNSREREERWFLKAVVIPPYKRPLSRSSPSVENLGGQGQAGTK
ncbi:unnamed protein product [Mortierella alpina]